MKKCEHIVIFGIDAIGTYIKDADTPNIDRIMEDGATTYRALCSRTSGSPEGWGSILTGTSANCHNLYWPVYDRDKTRLQPTFFSMIRKVMPDAVLGSICDWRDINDYFIEDDIGVYKQNVPEKEVVEKACEFLLQKKPTVLFTYLESPDDVGHTLGWGTVPYYDSITKCDGYVGRMYEAAQTAGMTKENTLFIVVGDHGGISYAHGCWHDFEKFVFLGVAGCGVEKADLGDVNIRDVAAIVLHALGITLPAYNEKDWTAQIPNGLFQNGNGRDYRQVVRLHRNLPENLPTSQYAYPVKEKLEKLFGEKKPVLALTFDGEIKDEAGNYVPVQCYRDGEPITARKYGSKGTRHIRGGMQGDCLLCDVDGYLAIPELKPGTGSFSAAFWFYLDTELSIQQSTDTVFSNNSYGNVQSDGFRFRIGDSLFTMILTTDGVSALLGRNEDSITVGAHRIPEEFDGGWMHVTVVVDREQSIYRLYCGFQEIGTEKLPENLQDKNMDGCGTLRIGHQVGGIGAHSNQYMIDDFFWFDWALGQSDVERLYTYYYGI